MKKEEISRILGEAMSVQGWTRTSIPGLGWLEISAVPLELIGDLFYIPCVVIYHGKKFRGTAESVTNDLFSYAFSKVKS